MRHASSSLVLSLVAVAVFATGCSRDPSSPTTTSEPNLGLRFAGLVTNAAPRTALNEEVTFVSMAPGAMRNAVQVTVENQRTRQTITGQAVDGGFDPVAIGARAGDTVLVSFTFAGNPTERHWAVVPASRRPAMLRSDAVGRPSHSHPHGFGLGFRRRLRLGRHCEGVFTVQDRSVLAELVVVTTLTMT